MSQTLFSAKLRAPTPTQTRLSFCDASPRDLKRWIAGLPKANIGETARLLYQGLGELNSLLTPGDNRLHLLELLRPEVYFVCQHLERHFLHQAIMLDERSRKVSNLCQALQAQLAIGYKQIVLRIAPKYSKERAALVSTALQRAAHALKGQLVRATQLYSSPPEHLWLELHQLYRSAVQLQLHQRRLRDDLAYLTSELSVEQTYIAALMLGSARCNQLRQSQISRLAEVIEPWSALPRLNPVCAEDGLFAISPELDVGPRYRKMFRSEQQGGLLGFDPQPLVMQLENHLLHQPAATPLPLSAGLSVDTLQHLHATWGQAAERSFQRIAGQGTLTVCVGMSALHFYLSGERTFSELLKHPGARAANFGNVVVQGEKDSWSQAFDAAPQGNDDLLPYEEIQYDQLSEDEGPNNVPNYPTYALPVINHSPGGYCLAWPSEVPAELQAGEMLGIEDSESKGWSIAVIRWIRQVRGSGTQIGIELVAPHAQPCGLQLVRPSDEHSQYLRGLLLPQFSAIDLPATLLAPRLPFQEGSKVLINTQGEEHRAGLDRRVASTHSFNQFAYRSLDPAQNGAGQEDFDSLWKSL
ncbi:molecular chaperone [Pseudomonas sp. SWRI153]|uniref:Molecular chaperone n=1 Tax=Pseudomonas khorasanensis TaxID=2745508 RepID=A0A923F457_9PSED|nr:molecular chaperone [Pseudomonas khorasanensis]MBV4486380.1 molecular chaperone [Pseudomonas khorasanensis]